MSQTTQDINQIVDKLNQAPFEYELSLVSFSEKSPDELLECFGDVVDKIFNKKRRDNEDLDMLAGRILEFLRYVKYKPSVDQLTLREGIINGEQEVIYPVLRWILQQNLEKLGNAAYVGFYLTDVEIPEEFLHDETILDAQQQVKELQREFIDVHKEVTMLRRGSQDPAEVRRRMVALEEEREQLINKVEKTKEKVEASADAVDLLEAAQLLRKQQEEALANQQGIEQQREQLETAETRYERASSRLRELQTTSADGSPAALLANLQQEVAQNRMLSQERLPAEIEKRTKRLAAIQQVLSEPAPTEADITELQRQRDSSNAEINNIMERLQRARGANSSQDMALRQQQNMANMIAKKKEECEAKLDRLQEKKAALQEEHEGFMAAAMPIGPGAPDAQDFKLKIDSVKSKLGTYKRMKSELSVLQQENLVLTRTEEILKSEATAAGADLAAAERKAGVSGASQTQQALEEVSMQKSEVDEAKGQTLEEISRLVTDINQAIKDRKSALAPQIKELRAVRTAQQELESEHAAKRQVYDAQVMGFEAQNKSLRTQVEAMRKETSEAERRYHAGSCLQHLVDTDIKRATAHTEASKERDSLMRHITSREEVSKKLKMRQKELKETGSQALGQLEVFQDLKKLIKLKIELSAQGNVGQFLKQDAGIDVMMGAANVMTL